MHAKLATRGLSRPKRKEDVSDAVSYETEMRGPHFDSAAMGVDVVAFHSRPQAAKEAKGDPLRRNASPRVLSRKRATISYAGCSLSCSSVAAAVGRSVLDKT